MPQRQGRLIVIDGSSSAGKSTISAHLRSDPTLRLTFVRRYTTRAPRPGDEEEDNYIFVTPERFAEVEEEHAFVEVRHFAFGMSYGLPSHDVDTVLRAGGNALAIISLGNIDTVRRRYPEALGIFITAPIETVEARLRGRGLDEDKIRERLNNASYGARFSSLYDQVIVNEDGKLEAAVRAAQGIIRHALQLELGR